MLANMQYMSERGILAMTPGEALDSVLGNLQIDQTRVSSLKTLVSRPESLEEFSADAQYMIKALWESRLGS